MESALVLVILFLVGACTLLIIHHYVNTKLKILVYLIFGFALSIFIIFYYFYLPAHSPTNDVYNAGIKFYSCKKIQLSDKECNESYSNLEASKVRAEIRGIDTKILEKTIELAELEANPGKSESPYIKIGESFNKFPLYITAKEDNFLMYDRQSCKFIEKPFYKILGWITDRSSSTMYIAIYKSNHCPNIDEITNFPIITQIQYQNLKEGNYWNTRSNDILPYYKQQIVLVDNPNLSLQELNNLPNYSNPNKLVKKGDKKPFYNGVSDIQYLGSYGSDSLELYKSSKSCFIAIYGKTGGQNQGVIFWNPKYPEWLVLYPNESKAIEAIIFSRKNQSKMNTEIVTNFTLILDNISYPTKGVYIDKKLVKLTNLPISNMKEKLIDADDVSFYLSTLDNIREKQNNYIFGLDGFKEAINAYDLLCKDKN